MKLDQGGASEIYPTHASAGFDLGDVGAKVKGARSVPAVP